jgi:C1A family cysteine protease
MTFPALGALLAAGLLLLLPAASPAAGGRVAPVDPAFTQYFQAAGGHQGRSLGLVPAPVGRAAVPRVRFAPLMALFPDRFTPPSAAATSSPLAAAAPGGAQAEASPASYDLVALGKLSPIRDQGRYGTCWAFAALASLESGLLPGAANDFSENNMAQRSGFSLGYGDGGNSYMAAAYLLRWAGPVTEAADPYAPYASSPTPSPEDAAVGTHVHEFLELPSRSGPTDNDDLKWAVMTYGAVYTSMYWKTSAFREASDAYFFSGSSGPNHAVTLVGWDDAYPASRFASPPAGPGAFLVRNSWGTSFGQSGYFWVSYDDTAFATDNAVFAGAEAATAGERIYQHDPLGWVASYRPSGAADPATAWFAAAYTAAEAGTLNAAGFYATASDAAYEVRIASSVEGIADAPVAATGILAVPGYHTVTLDAPVAVAAGRRLVIAVRVTVPGYSFPIAVERPWSGYANATAAAGQSYVSGDGVTWTDMTRALPDTDVCLKGYGVSSEQPAPDATPPPGPTTTPAPEPTPAPDPAPAPDAPVAPTVRLSDAAAAPGAVARVVFRVAPADGGSTANVRLTVRTRSGAVVRRQTLRNVSVAALHTWRVRAPTRRATYVVAAVAILDTGAVSKRATATLRVR